MPRPTTKEQLINAGKENFTKLFKLIESLNQEEQEMSFLFEDRDKNIRDVLVLLYEWHQLLLKWISNNVNGVKSNFLPEPYNWKTYPEMNFKLWEKHQSTSFKESISLVKQSHADVLNLISTFSTEELFTNKYFNWTGTTSVGSYCVSATSSHYDWAMKKIKKHKKSLADR